VKARGHARGDVLELLVEIEISALEQSAPAARIRKIVSRGPVNAPLERPTTAFTAEDEGQKYELTITPHKGG
jgi:hypothetical protein